MLFKIDFNKKQIVIDCYISGWSGFWADCDHPTFNTLVPDIQIGVNILKIGKATGVKTFCPEKMDSCTLETLAPKLNCPGGLTFCHEKSIFGILGPTVQGSKILPWKKYTWTPDKLGSWAQLSGSPNMCLDKWTVVPPKTLTPGPKFPGAQLSALKKGTVVPRKLWLRGPTVRTPEAQLSALK